MVIACCLTVRFVLINILNVIKGDVKAHGSADFCSRSLKILYC